MLRDSIIHFGENLPKRDLANAYDHARKSDLCIVLGSSLSVSPANDIPRTVAKRGGKLVIVNLQPTDLDNLAELRIFAQTDIVARHILEALSEAKPDVDAVVESPQPLFPSAVRVAVSNVATLSDEGDSYKWSVSATATLANPATSPPPVISQVEYNLHPTFQPSHIVVPSTETNPECRLSCRGWGTFVVNAKVHLSDGRLVDIAHPLQFVPGCHQTAVLSV